MQPLYKLYRLVLDDPDRLMALTILSLHALLVWGDTSVFFNALLLCHYGFLATAANSAPKQHPDMAASIDYSHIRCRCNCAV